MEIKTNTKVGDTVYWVKEIKARWRIYEATVEEITLCEYQGALYCTLYCPDFKINPYPVVHYSYVFHTRQEAEEHKQVLQKSDGFPMCDGCKFAWRGRGA